MVVAVAVAEAEVGRVVRHGVPLGLDADAGIGEREVARQVTGHGYRLHRVALMGSHGIEGFIQFHVGVQRVILRTHLVLAHGVIDGYGDLRLFGEELTQFEIGRHGVRLLGIGRPLHHALLQASETIGHVAARQVDAAKVAQLHIEGTRGSPASFIIILAQAKLVDPHLTRLHAARQVAHTDNHGLHLAKAGVTHHAHLVVWPIFIVLREQLVEADLPLGLGFVALLLQPCKHA